MDGHVQVPVAKQLYQARLNDTESRRRDVVQATVAARTLEAATNDTDRAPDAALRTAIQSVYIDVMKGTLDRSITRAQYLSAAAGAIATTYAGLLGLIYSAKDRPLVAWAIAPSLFLAGSFVFAVIYVAFISRSVFEDGPLIPVGSDGEAEQRLKRFLHWTNSGVVRRSWALRAAVIALGVGVATMPLPFIDLTESQRQRM